MAIQPIQIDSPTLISYTAILIALLGALVALFWSREERAAAFWYSLPFALGVIGAGFTVNPEFKAGDWGLRIGALFIVMAYGFYTAKRSGRNRTITSAMA